jgi:hypothetical protein
MTDVCALDGKPGVRFSLRPSDVPSHGIVSARAQRILGTDRRQAGCPDIGSCGAASVKRDVLAEEMAPAKKGESS